MREGTAAKFVRAIRIRARETDWRRWRWRNLDKTKLAWPFRVMLHPVTGFNEVKYDGRGSAAVAAGIWLLVFLVSVVQFFEQGFVFNQNRPQDFNVFYQFFISSALILLWSIVNWALCTLLDGEGRFRDIWIVSCYAFFPQALFGIPLVALSNVLCLEEQSFLLMFQALLAGWCLLLLFIGILTIHQFSFRKALLSGLLTLAGMLALLYLVMLFTSMAQQLMAFVRTIIREAASRR